jgi:hypothetical protein
VESASKAKPFAKRVVMIDVAIVITACQDNARLRILDAKRKRIACERFNGCSVTCELGNGAYYRPMRRRDVTVGVLAAGFCGVVSLACRAVEHPQAASDLPDGFYAALEDAQPVPAGFVPIEEAADFADGAPRTFYVRKAGFVPLEIAGAPVTERTPGSLTALQIALIPSSVEPLRLLTTEQLNKAMAIVIDGKAIGRHRVRQVIEGGKMQITRCGDNACERVKTRLVARAAK